MPNMSEMSEKQLVGECWSQFVRAQLATERLVPTPLIPGAEEPTIGAKTTSECCRECSFEGRKRASEFVAVALSRLAPPHLEFQAF